MYSIYYSFANRRVSSSYLISNFRVNGLTISFPISIIITFAKIEPREDPTETPSFHL